MNIPNLHFMKSRCGDESMGAGSSLGVVSGGVEAAHDQARRANAGMANLTRGIGINGGAG
jgi:hypothetical protein